MTGVHLVSKVPGIRDLSKSALLQVKRSRTGAGLERVVEGPRETSKWEQLLRSLDPRISCAHRSSKKFWKLSTPSRVVH